MPYKSGVCEIPKGVKNIAWHAFENCELITEVIMPESVTNIGVFAFADCKKLAQVKLSSKIKKLNSNVFAGCKELKNIELPATLTAIGSSAFDGASIKELVIPETVKTFKAYAFDKCKLSKVTILGNVKPGMRAFGKATFVLYAKNLPLSQLKKAYQECALFGYAEMYSAGQQLQQEITDEYKLYVKENMEKVTVFMLKKPALLDFVLALKCLPDDKTAEIVGQVKQTDKAEFIAVLTKHGL